MLLFIRAVFVLQSKSKYYTWGSQTMDIFGTSIMNFETEVANFENDIDDLGVIMLEKELYKP